MKRKRQNPPTVQQIVDGFLDYFRHRGHEVVASAPLLPSDPTLLFTSAGMVPFKAYYGEPDTAPFPRAASVQKCLRAGGKQSDLENVGRTLRHHTFFEMLGNFSFGDYFKREAIEWGWELSIDVWGLDRDRIWVSIFEDDDEAFNLWTNRIGFPADRIARLGRKDNFWGPVGETGVCGPCSEMYFDTGAERGCGRPGCAPGCDCDRFIEYWNLVFPQFIYTDSGGYDALQRPGIDTGMGLERIAFVLQGVSDNFHTDEMLPIRNAVAAALPDGVDAAETALALNVGADHVRALTFALAEGIMPANDGRGYVLRRLLRRALTKMHPFGVEEPFLAPAVDVVVEKMSGRYPELSARAPLVKEMITSEERRFLTTLGQGMEKLAGFFERASNQGGLISGFDAFVLYDTYGFPFELTVEMAEDRGLSVDGDGFEKAMTQQRERARRKSFHTSGDGGGPAAFEWVSPAAPSKFVGYDTLRADARVLGWRLAPGCDDAAEIVEIVCDRTPFYGESGGQVGDFGSARAGDRDFVVARAFHEGDYVVHAVEWPAGAGVDRPVKVLTTDAVLDLRVDGKARLATARNHTATHLLHAALRRVLGDHVAQAGSLVAPDRLRFDFSHFRALDSGEIAAVQDLVNQAVLEDIAVDVSAMSYAEAVAAGAMALFGEKYGDSVRVVRVDGWSQELCGGTHLERTGQAGLFLVTSESAVGSGVRRIEAVTGGGALSYVESLVDERRTLAELFKVSPDDVARRARAVLDEIAVLEAEVKRARGERAKGRAADALRDAETIGTVLLVAARVDAADVPGLRGYGDELRNRLDLGLGVLSQNRDDKPVVLIVASDRLIEEMGVTATDVARRIASELSFRGGGKPHMAQIGMPSAADFDAVVAVARSVLKSAAGA